MGFPPAIFLPVDNGSIVGGGYPRSETVSVREKLLVRERVNSRQFERAWLCQCVLVSEDAYELLNACMSVGF